MTSRFGSLSSRYKRIVKTQGQAFTRKFVAVLVPNMDCERVTSKPETSAGAQKTPIFGKVNHPAPNLPAPESLDANVLTGLSSFSFDRVVALRQTRKRKRSAKRVWQSGARG